MSQKSIRTITGSSLALLAVLFIALTVLVNVLFRGARVDLTDNQLYTVSEGTGNILESLDEPINLYLYYSEQASADIAAVKTYAIRVRELLEEFAERSGGKINLQVIDPLPFSEAEDQASSYGLQGVPAGPGGDNVFFGLVGTNAVDGREVIPFFDPSKENFLEYDLAKLVYNLANPKKPVIGLMTDLPINRSFDPATRQMREPWLITTQVEQLFQVRQVPTTATSIDADVDVLMLVHPKDLSPEAQYAIDQFVLRGGKLALFLDPHAEVDQPENAGMDPQAAMFASRSSNLPNLLSKWGIAYDASKVILDAKYGLQVSAGPGRRPVRHIGILSITPEAMVSDDVTLAQLSSINLSMSGYIAQAAGAETSFETLMSTSELAQPVGVDRVKFLPDPSSLLNGYSPTGEQYALAARVQGTVGTAFPDGPPGSEPGADPPPGHLLESVEAVNIVVVADADILSDRLWAQSQSFFGQRLISAFANNGDFVVNVLDNLTGSSDLINVRGRATSRRPFTRVQELEREAEERFRATEQQLEQELQETERKLSELQRGRDDGNSLILSPEQQAELDRFQEERVRIRKELRQVKANLREDIEDLGTTLKIINIGLVPLLLTLFALGMAAVRAGRRKED